MNKQDFWRRKRKIGDNFGWKESDFKSGNRNSFQRKKAVKDTRISAKLRSESRDATEPPIEDQ